MKTREQTYGVLIEENVPAAMRDGAVLRADIWRPDAEGRFPGLLIRTPYGKSSYKSTFEWAAERGYVVVSQDIRGRYTSDGEFHPLYLGSRFEAQDGYDTVEWVASLPYCNGKVGVFGCSYNAWTAWELAWTRPPHLVAMFVGGIGARSTDGPFHPIIRTGCLLYWLINTMAPDTRRRVRGPKPWTKEEAIKLWEENRWKWIWFPSLKDIPERVLGGLVPHYREWLRAPNVDYWRFREKHKEISVPVFQFTGWYDRQALGTIDHYMRMVKNAKTIRARRGQKLLIGPWSHGWGAGGQAKIGDMDFGLKAVIDYRFKPMIRWFDYWLKGVDNGIMDGPPVRIFVMGANSWRYEREWPPARTQYQEFYLHSGGAANTPSGDWVLSLDPPGDEPTDSYVYDPRDPVPTLYLPSGQDAPRD